MKRTPGDLALFGGPPAFLQPVAVGRPTPVDRTRLFERLNWALDNQWLSNGGPLTCEFEARIAELAGTRHCVATSSGTSALQLLVRAAELSGEVIMPSLTFVATAHAVRWLGLTPVFCDVDERTGQLDPARVSDAITARTAAIIGVHLWGNPCAAAELEKIAADHGLWLFFDAAHALGCSADGRPVGGFGAATAFSFHTTKVVGAFEGGALVTDDGELAARARALGNFGKGLEGGSPAGGTNAKMSEAAAAMGLTSLDAYEAVAAGNRSRYERYRAELAGVPGVTIRPCGEQERSNHQYVIAEVDKTKAGIGRDLLLELLRAENALVAPPIGVPPCHQLEPYRSQASYELPRTEALASRTLSLPTGSTVSAESIRRLCALVRFAVAHGPGLTDRRREQALAEGQ
ncbi:dTDP-4-amino-4,6-dideoxy-D-glucose transaminase [Streptomyces sp. YIM 130001]|uniref:aminotransferase class I/II-fold pyridoxal phosphate-dependent enzyme n=1 Tax=Streptomyces sp. YIM 130001 TaxID=2259644 RepID=UPI000E6480CB|nr:aminotransferase class I/II-fold pyridoxal phosphate-dependent enzyme [Streptomyces sp. YIM 130001]RII07924.1 dTDP-4-amino-4,6-dideoxy-D-glucose transaminase [Streptomyces sp. YIM 130001]